MGKLMFEIGDETVRKAQRELENMLNEQIVSQDNGIYLESSEFPIEYAPIGGSENVCVLPLKTMEGENPLAVKFWESSYFTKRLRTYGSENMALSLDRVDYTADNVAALVSLSDFPVAIAPHRRLPIHLECPSEADIGDRLIFENYYPIYGCLVPDLSLKGQKSVRDMCPRGRGDGLPKGLREIREEIVNRMSSLVCLFPRSHEAAISHGSSLEHLRDGVTHMILFPEDDPEALVAADLNHFWIPYGGYPGGGEGPLRRLEGGEDGG